jgi:hypothetical protein
MVGEVLGITIMAISASKPIALKPSAGFLDLRSDAADIAIGHRRIVLNKQVREQGKEARSGGLVKLFGESEHGFLNQDLHDKDLDAPGDECLFGEAGGACNEAITFLFGAESDSGARRLLAGGNRRMHELAQRSGVWRVVADGLGNPTTNPSADNCEPCVGNRIRAAQLLGYVVATNNYNTPFAYRPGFQVNGCDSGTIGDLETLGVTRVGVITQFKGFILLADIVMDGVAYPGMVMHSDFNAPLDFVPLVGTNLARSLTIGFSERVLAMEPFGDYLIAYTDKGIWRGVLNIQFVNENPAQVFSFTRIYEGPHSLRYKYSLVSTGNEHLIGSVDGVYVLRSAFSAPERVEWIHRATGAIYEGLNRWNREFADLPDGVNLNYGPLNTDACDNFIGFYNPLTSEVLFSWPTDDNVCANLSLRMNIRQGYEHASLVDEGFSAGVYFRPDDRPTYEEWLLEVAGCPMSTPTQLTSSVTPPPYIWNAEENPLGEIAEDSLCAMLGDTTLDDICRQCEAAPVFIVASTRDNSLKELRDDLYYREFWNGTDYDAEGYADFVQTILGTLNSDVEKAFGGSEIPGLVAEFTALSQTTPGDLQAQVGFGVSGACPTWRNVGTRKLRCLEHEARFGFFYRGNHISFRMWTYGTGNGHSISRIDAHVKAIQTRG